MDKILDYKSHYTGQIHKIHFKNLLEDTDGIDGHILKDTLFERPDHNYNILLQFLKPNDIVWDIGSYIGTFSIPFAIEGLEVHAFEGFPYNFERLGINCKPYKNITTHMCALSNENKKVISNFGDCTTVDQKPTEIEYFICDEYVENYNISPPKLVKMDIEGMESLALLGMSNILENVRPIWQIGFHHPGNILIENPEQKIEGYPGFVIPEEGGFDFETFEKLNYYVFDMKRGMRESKFLWGDCNGEYLCIPKELVRIS
tara:strand:+ start:190 stop:966 length:777 start_codon:yes stop_codon:yes gene_type:complete